MTNLGTIAKATTGAVVAGFTAAISALDDGHITSVEWTVIAVAFLGALGVVYAIPNIPDSVRSYAKAITAALISGAGALGVALANGGGVSQSELLTIAIALAVGGGLVSQVPNARRSEQTLVA